MPSPTADRCAEILRRLDAPGLTPAELAPLDDHLDECDACTGARLARARVAFDEAPPPRVALGRFVVEELLGSGNMGTVFAGWDPELDRAVALKVLRPGRDDDRDAERLLREARAMAQVRHANVVTVYDVGRDQDVIYVAMERVAGPSLRAAMAAGASSAQRERWLRQVVHGLAAVHAAGLVHRDVKPDNIFVEGDRAMLGDFGLATALDLDRDRDAIDATVARGTEGAGTPAYMAPEQLRGERGDARTDVFAFGVTAWEALTGARPFAGATTLALVRAIEQGPPAIAPGLPPALAAIVRQCLHVERARRPADAAAILAALEVAPARRPWRRGAAIAGGTLVALAAVTIAIARRPNAADAAALGATCEPTAPAFDAGWSTAAAALPALVRDGIAQTMQRRAQAWAEVGATACAGDPFTRTAWMTCRHRVGTAERALVAVAVEQAWADPGPLLREFDALDPPASCATTAAAEDALDLARATPSARVALIAGQRALAKARGYHAVDASAQLERALRTADRRAAWADLPTFDTERRLVRLELQPPAALPELIAALEAVVGAAERTGRAALVARAWLALATAASELATDPVGLEHALAQADWAITRLDDPPRLRVPWLLIEAARAWGRGERDRARTAIIAAADASGDDPLLAASRGTAVGRLASLGGDDTAAAAAYRSLLADRELMQALDVRSQARLVALLAECEYRLGNADAAARAIDEALALGRAGLPVDDPMQITNQIIAASIRHDQGDARGALAELDAAQAAAERALGPDSALLGSIELRRAYGLLELGEGPAAVAAARTSIRINDQRAGRRNESSVTARFLVADALFAAGDLPGCLAVYAEADRDAVAVYGAMHPMRAQNLPGYAAALVASDRLDEARALLELAVDALASSRFSPEVLADARRALAEVVARADRRATAPGRSPPRRAAPAPGTPARPPT